MTDRWSPTSIEKAPSPRYSASAVWTGRSMIVWGGTVLGEAGWANDGGQYFVGGSSDDDGDGFSECAGDCNDGSAAFFPDAAETCDGQDQDCNGVADDADADADGYFVCADCNDADPLSHSQPGPVTGITFAGDKNTLSWNASLPMRNTETTYDVARGQISELPVGSGASERCLVQDTLAVISEDLEVPLPGDGYWYLVRKRWGCTGTYGANSAGDARSTAACEP